MAVTACKDWATADSRFKSWGKVVRSATELDLLAHGAYALGNRFVRWGESVALGEGEYLILASEHGSRNSHTYQYKLVEGGREPREIDKSEVMSYVEALGDLVTEEEIAWARNHTLHAYALYIAKRGQE